MTPEGALESLVGQRVAVAWSGGADSTALLHAAVEVLGGPAVVALHVDHGMREGSAQDLAFCRAGAQQLGATFGEGSLELGSMASEAVARAARYSILGQLCREHGVTTLLTGHHGNDNLESLLLALIRGSGLTGLAGIRATTDLAAITGQPTDRGIAVRRPFLPLTRAGIVAWLGQREYRTDPTNQLHDRRRNRIRHEVVPALLDIADTPDPALRTPSTLDADRALLERLARVHLDQARRDNGWELEILLRADEGLWPHWLRALLCTHTAHPPDWASVQRVLAALVRGRSGRFQVRGAEVTLTKGIVQVWPTIREEATPAACTIDVGQDVMFGSWRLAIRSVVGRALPADCEAFDLAGIELPLHVRAPRPGERISRLHGRTSPIRRLLADAGMPAHRRSFVPVVTDSRGQMLLVGGAGRARTAPITEDTEATLHVSCSATHAHEDCGGDRGSL